MSTTIRQRNEINQQLIVDSTYVDQLMTLLKCTRSTCPNNRSWCYELDSIHLKILPLHMTTWSKSINNGSAQLNVAPDGLIKGLLPSKSGTKNPLREETASATQNSGNRHFSSHGDSTAPAITMHRFDPYTGLPLHKNNSYPPSPHVFSSPTSQSLTDAVMFSDSIEEGTDPAETLIEYLDWLCRISPRLAGQFSQAKDALMEAGQTFKTIETTPMSEFKKIGINFAIGQQVKDYRRVYKRRVLGKA